jgi:hypothetical protein
MISEVGLRHNMPEYALKLIQEQASLMHHRSITGTSDIEPGWLVINQTEIESVPLKSNLN